MLKLVKKIIQESEQYAKDIKESKYLSQKQKDDALGDLRRQIIRIIAEAQLAIDNIEQREIEQKLEKKGIKVPF